MNPAKSSVIDDDLLLVQLRVQRVGPGSITVFQEGVYISPFCLHWKNVSSELSQLRDALNMDPVAALPL